MAGGYANRFSRPGLLGRWRLPAAPNAPFNSVAIPPPLDANPAAGRTIIVRVALAPADTWSPRTPAPATPLSARAIMAACLGAGRRKRYDAEGQYQDRKKSYERGHRHVSVVVLQDVTSITWVRSSRPGGMKGQLAVPRDGEFLNTADRLEPNTRVDFALREDRCLRPETLDDAAHEWPDIRRSH